MINLEIFSMLVFFSLVGIFLFKGRKSLEKHGIIFIRRWKRGLDLIDSLIRRHPKAVKIYGRIALVLGILVMVGGFVMLLICDVLGIKLFGFVLPTAGGYKYPGPIVGVPFWYWLIAIFIIIFVHETSHGILARLAKVKLKNYGIILLLVLPVGAFVEPDDKKLKRLKTVQKIQIFAAGSFANFITGLIFLGLGMLLASSVLIPFIRPYIIEPYGVYFNDTVIGYPAHDANLTGVITNINGIPIKTTDNLSSLLNSTNPGTNISIITSMGNYSVITVARPDNLIGSFIGISYPTTYYAYRGWSAVVLQMFTWLVGLNIGVGIANLLPMKPFDGGLMLEEISARFLKKHTRLIVKIFTILTIGLIVYNMFGIK
jgi:membrane-associated protease RseP (regulator of RpoE activity)